MQHCDKKGNPKLLESCNLPLTGISCVDRIVTDRAVIDIENHSFVLKEVAPGCTPEDVAEATGAPLKWHGSVPLIQV
jgi:3-oxoacid CoA-transferase subunit B